MYYRKETIMQTKQFKDFDMSDFTIVEMPQREIKPGQKVRCTFFRLKPSSYKPARQKLEISEMPKEMYEALFQKRV